MSEPNAPPRDYWKSFWRDYPKDYEGDLFKQVGHTIGGHPYSGDQFRRLIESIKRHLELTGDEQMLDVCCGNGLITSQIAPYCKSVVALDFSDVLIESAMKHRAASNITYMCLDALELGSSNIGSRRFDRILMYAALQHFEVRNLETLLRGFRDLSSDGAIIVIGGVLDEQRKMSYLDTDEKREMYKYYCEQGKDRLGTWWDPSHVEETCREMGLHCQIYREADGRPGAHYRFDAIIRGR